MNLEEWKIYPLNDNYMVSNLGRIKSVRFNKILTPKINWDGYHRIQIWKNNKCNMVSWHRVVAQTWVDNPDNKPIINHIDGVKDNNHPSNLEWVTQQENIQHAWETGLAKRESKFLPVLAYDPDGNLIGKYDDFRDIEDELNIDYFAVRTSILKNGKTQDGFKFILHENSNDYSLGK